MLLKSLVLFFLATNAHCFPQSRVVNGTDAKEGEIPYIVGLLRASGKLFCAGSILDATHILTAAHCVVEKRPEEITVKYGVTDLQTPGNTAQVSSFVYHEDYQRCNDHANDVAVLSLDRPIPLGPTVQPTELPEQGDAIPANQVSVLAGWGRDSSEGTVQRHLQRVDLKIYSAEDCKERHGGRTNPKYHICSGVDEGGKGQCNGDSGGPLYSGGVQVGVVSWSVKPCTISPFPGVYARVSQYVDWIKKQTQNVAQNV